MFLPFLLSAMSSSLMTFFLSVSYMASSMTPMLALDSFFNFKSLSSVFEISCSSFLMVSSFRVISYFCSAMRFASNLKLKLFLT